MRVIVVPDDRGACGYYRCIWPAEALAAQGHDVTIQDETLRCDGAWIDVEYGMRLLGFVSDRRAFNRLIGAFGAEMKLLKSRHATMLEEHAVHNRWMREAEAMLDEQGRDAIDADVVVWQKPLSRREYETIAALQRIGVAVVVEVDDDFHAIHPRNAAWKGTNPLTNPDSHRDWLKLACERADLVTASTPALAERYGAHGRVRVLDNYVPARYCTLERPEHDGVRVGWSGSVATHPGDLEVTEGAVAQSVARHGATLAVVGTGERVATALQHDGPVAATGWVPIDDYPAALATLNVGIVPLKAGPFNEAKSHLKGLEYAAVGVPFVATPTGPYQTLAFAGIGWTAETPASWRYLLAELIQDGGHREALSERYRAEVAAQWTIEGNAWRWPEAWADAVTHRRATVAA